VQRSTKDKDKNMSKFKITITITDTDEYAADILTAAYAAVAEGPLADLDGDIPGHEIEVEDVSEGAHFDGNLREIDPDDIDDPGDTSAHVEIEGEHWIIFRDAEAAGEAARERWADMAHNDPEEFACMVGQETLAAWALGQYAGPGSVQVKSLEEWLDLVADNPAEELASYDGEQVEISNATPAIIEALGFTPTVAYRQD
jgi:hypothetical protein